MDKTKVPTKVQGVQEKLCFFEGFWDISGSGLSLFSFGVNVCTHTRQVEH